MSVDKVAIMNVYEGDAFVGYYYHPNVEAVLEKKKEMENDLQFAKLRFEIAYYRKIDEKEYQEGRV